MFLKNAWYPVLWSKDLAETPVARTIMNEPVVFFRAKNEAIGALEDRCCHRAAPLSLGKVSGNFLECGYHGIKFDNSGICVEIPGQDQVPPKARVRSYPVCEKWSVIWIWMGESISAEESKIPNLPWLSDDSWTKTHGYLKLAANYQLLIENLLDLTHVYYLHASTLGGDAKAATVRPNVRKLDDGVEARRWMIDVIPPPLFASVGNIVGNADRLQAITWRAPSIVYIEICCAKTGTGAPEGDRSQGVSLWSSHLICPETETSTHYLFGHARDFEHQNQEVSKILYEGAKSAFLEDAVMLEAQQKNLPDGTLEDGLIHIVGDAAGLQYRRMWKGMLDSERRANNVA